MSVRHYPPLYTPSGGRVRSYRPVFLPKRTNVMPDFQYYEDLPRGFHASLAQPTTVQRHTDIPRGQRLGYYDLTPAPTEIAAVVR